VPHRRLRAGAVTTVAALALTVGVGAPAGAARAGTGPGSTGPAGAAPGPSGPAAAPVAALAAPTHALAAPAPAPATGPSALATLPAGAQLLPAPGKRLKTVSGRLARRPGPRTSSAARTTTPAGTTAPVRTTPTRTTPTRTAPAGTTRAGTTAPAPVPVRPPGPPTPTAPAPAARPVPVSAAPVAAGPSFGLPVNAAELTPAELETALDLALASGATSVSSGAVWWYLTERTGPRRYDFSSLDRLLAAAERRGMSVSLQLSGTPDWVHPELQRTVPDFWQRIWHAPRGSAELAAWSGFVGDVVGRYGTRVARYEMWNEPNLAEFWRSGPSPAEYSALLRAGYLAAKAAAPGATVVSGGLSRNDVGFATAMYDALAAFPDAGASRHFFDELGVHPYSDDRGPAVTGDRWVRDGQWGLVDESFLGLRRMTALLASRGEAGKKVYVGEYGFSTSRTWMAAVPDATRAGYARQALALVRDLPQVSGFVWYAFLPTSSDDSAWSIASLDGRRSATYSALVADARG
jgi:hypothetical protein